MAIINKMRKSGWVFVVILAALALFVLSDFITSFQRGGGGFENPVVGEINGQEISYSEYDEVLKGRIQMREQNKQGEPLDDNDRAGAENDAWDDLFRKYVVSKEYEKLGIEASTEELRTLLFSDDAHAYVKQYFTDEQGQFSSSNVRNWYNQVYKTNPEAQIFFNSLKDAIVSSVQSDKYRDLIEKGIHVTNFDVLQDFMAQSKTVTGSVVGLQLTSVSDEEVSFTEEELRTYYNNNKEKFKQTESRDLEFVSWSIIPSAHDSADVQNLIMLDIPAFASAEDDSAFAALASDKEVVTAYKQLGDFIPELNSSIAGAEKGQIVGPVVSNGAYVIAKISDIREGEQIKYKYRDITIGKDWHTKEDSLEKIAEAKEFFETMKTTPFSSIAETARNRGYMVVGDAEGNIAWATEDHLDPIFASEIKKGNKGDYIFKVSERGIHLLWIEENPNNNEYLAVEIQREIAASMATINEIYSQASQFRSKLTNGKDGKFDNAIEEAGYAKRIARDVLRSGSKIPGIDDSKEILKWAFDDSRKINDISDVISVDERQVVVHISNLRKDGIGAFDAVRDKVIEEVLKEKKLALLETKLAKAKEDKPNMIQTAIELGTVAHDFTRTTFKSNEFQAARDEANVHGVALGLQPNVASNPIRGENGCYIVMVTEESNPEIPDNLDSRKGMVNMEVVQTLESKVVSSLKALAKIQDYRNKYY